MPFIDGVFIATDKNRKNLRHSMTTYADEEPVPRKYCMAAITTNRKLASAFLNHHTAIS